MKFTNILLNKLLSKKRTISSEEEVENVYESLKRFAKDIIKPNLWMILLAVFFMAIFSAANAGMAWLVRPIMNQMFSFKEMGALYIIGFSLIGISLVKSSSQYIYTVLLSGVSIGVIAKARANLYNNFIIQDMQFFHNNSPGSLISVMMNDINAINTLASDVPINLGRDLLSFIGLFIVMLIQEPIYALLILFLVFFIIIPIRIIGKKVRQQFQNNNKTFAYLTSQMEQSFNGIREVKSYAMEERERLENNDIIENIRKTQLRIRRFNVILPTFMEAMGGISVALVLMYGGYNIIVHNENPGTFFSFIVALLLAYQPLKRLSDLPIKIQFGLLGVKRYYSFLDQKPQIIDNKDAKDIILSSTNIEFKDVTFAYNKGVNVLKNISFNIDVGKRLALVGKSGGGKSTILNLIMRFYETNSGNILINNNHIKDFTLNSLRQNIALVSQEIVLFDDTIYNNIAYSNPKASKEQIYKAAELSASNLFIEEFKDKYNTQVGSRGVKLSGGQRQRISIARALLKNAPILLLDEATSALDSEAEKHIQNSLDTLMVNRTSIVIAHRLSTIINSDKILVIDKGEIKEQGTHQELVNVNGTYKYLYDLQFNQQDIDTSDIVLTNNKS